MMIFSISIEYLYSYFGASSWRSKICSNINPLESTNPSFAVEIIVADGERVTLASVSLETIDCSLVDVLVAVDLES